MRLKLELVSRDASSRDVVVTCDASATVGDVARRLAGRAASAVVTLWVDPGAGEVMRPVNPLLSMNESGVRSGSRVAVAEVVAQQVVGEAVRARVTVLEGVDEGAVFALGDGVNFIGRDPAVQVRLQDGLVSRRHASLTVVSGSVVVDDLNSANGIEVNGSRAERAVVTSRDRLVVGDSKLRVEVLPSAGPVAGEASGFSRSPRVVQPWSGGEVPAPALPRAGERPRFAWIAVVAPIAAGGVLFALTRNPLMLVFIALSPVLMVASWWDQRVRQKRQSRDEQKRFGKGLESLAAELADGVVREREARLRESPSTEEALGAVQERSPLLWTRMPEHAAFLSVRLGVGELPSRTRVQLPTRDLGAASEWEQLRSLVDEHATVTGVPVVERLSDAGALGIAAEPAVASAIMRALLLQIASLHSPADVALCVLAMGSAEDEWAWAKWLPHIDSPHAPVRSPLASDVPSSSRMLAELEELIMQRRAGRSGARRVRSHLRGLTPGEVDVWEAVDADPVTPAVVVFVADASGVDRGRLVQLAEDGPDVGVYTVWVERHPEALPVVCRTFVSFAYGAPTVSFVRHGSTVRLTRVEALERSRAVAAARSLAPLEDDGAPILDESDLPSAVRLVDLFEDDIAADPGAVSGRWARSDSVISRWTAGSANREPTGLTALVGQGAAGPLRIDLRRDGPHALVGGTSGAGKSEFLQTWILGMAIEQSPDRLTFLLVDYKGGSAFGDCVSLPHTVGLVTDLTPHLVARALTSLRAELTRREELFAMKGAKDLAALEERADPDAPPALVIVIDEFAALVTEVPAFVDGVIDIAQRGRSLGLHLIMATQRPAGVIKESLRANTNLRVALRVADEADSVDVLGTPRAATFDADTPGRAAAKLGAGRVRDFQTAYVGGRAGTAAPDAGIQVRDLPFAPGQAWTDPTPRRLRSGPRDIERITNAIQGAAAQLRLPVARRPWLDPLPGVVDLADFTQSPGFVRIGIQDEPARQRQQPFGWEWDAVGSVAVFGAGGTGKTTLLRTIAAAVTVNPEDTWMYAIDTAGGLAMLRDSAHVGAVIAGNDSERVTRLIRWLSEHAQTRARLFAGTDSATLSDHNRQAPAPLPRIVVLIDGIAAFRAEYEFVDAGRLFDTFTQLLSAGRQVGIHLVVTAERHAAIPQSILASLSERVVLRMSSAAEADIAGVPRDMLDDAPAGRAYAHGLEVQIALPGGSTELAAQADALRRTRPTGPPAPAVKRLEEHIDWHALPRTVDGAPVYGVADDTLDAVGVADGLFVVTGPFGSGRSTAMRTIAHATHHAYPDLPAYLLSARPGDLSDELRWKDAATDPDTSLALATTLAATLTAPGSASLFIVVEDSSGFEGTPAESAIAGLLKAARRNPTTRVLVETDTVTAGSAWQIFTELKTARAGIVLQPEESDGASIFRVQFPRSTRADFPAGRGFAVTAGRVRRVQVARLSPEEGTRNG